MQAHLKLVVVSIGMCIGLASNVMVIAADLLSVKVGHQKKQYSVVSEAMLHVPPDVLYDTLMDFDNYERFSSIYVDARWLTRNPNDSGEIYVHTNGCVLFFCKAFERTEVVQGVRPQFIVTTVDSQRSGGIEGESRWRLEPAGAGTHLYFEIEFEPNFWVPPVIGPYFIKRMLRKNGFDALQRIETVAIENQAAIPTAQSDERGELIAIPGFIMKDVADVDASIEANEMMIEPVEQPTSEHLISDP